jgi:hypothetical protein
MTRALLAVTLLLFLTLPATASLVEDTLAPTGVHYQEDAGVPGDAPASCADLEADRAVTHQGATSAGILLDVDEDTQDVYALSLDESTVGTRVAVSLATSLLVDSYDVAIDVFSPDCASSVFDPDSAYYNPPPAEPYQPPVGSSGFEADLAGASCDPFAWKFIANQMGGAVVAPADIYVEWTNGEWEYVPAQKSTPATIAMYRTTSHLDVTIERAVIVLPATWHGSFHLASGPCGAVEGTNEPDPYLAPDLTYGNFTVQEAGTHVILVYVTRTIAEKTQATAEELLADPPTTIPVNCHRDICTLATDFASYDLGSQQAAA